MGVTGALMAGSAAINAVGKIAQGIQENKQAKQNAAIYEAQARNIETQKNIVAEQYRNRQNALRGKAIATAAKGGLRISGTTANSISQSIMQLQMDNSYEQYNYEVQKQRTRENASLQLQQGRNALMSGFMGAGQTALTAGYNYMNTYWKGTNNTTKNSNTKLSGGISTSNRSVFYGQPNTIA